MNRCSRVTVREVLVLLIFHGVGVTNNNTITGPGGVTINAGTGSLNNTGTGTITNRAGGTGAISVTASDVTEQSGTISNAGLTSTGTISLAADTMALTGSITGGAAAVSLLDEIFNASR